MESAWSLVRSPDCIISAWTRPWKTFDTFPAVTGISGVASSLRIDFSIEA